VVIKVKWWILAIVAVWVLVATYFWWFPIRDDTPISGLNWNGYKYIPVVDGRRIAELEKELELAKGTIKEVTITKIQYVPIYEPVTPVVDGSDLIYESERRGGIKITLHTDMDKQAKDWLAMWAFGGKSYSPLALAIGKDGKVNILSSDPLVRVADKNGNYPELRDKDGNIIVPDIIIPILEVVKTPDPWIHLQIGMGWNLNKNSVYGTINPSFKSWGLEYSFDTAGEHRIGITKEF